MTSIARNPDVDREVARRAYEIWEEDGRPEGRDHDHWVRAEQDVLATPAEQDAVATPADSAKPASRRKPAAKPAASVDAPAKKPRRKSLTTEA
jgi:hypothetical protein